MLKVKIIYGVHVYIRRCSMDLVYELVIHKHINRLIPNIKPEDIFIVYGDNPLQPMNIVIENFIGEPAVPLYVFHAFSSITDTKEILVPERVSAELKLLF